MPEIKIVSTVDAFYDFSELGSRKGVYDSLIDRYKVCDKLMSIDISGKLILNDLRISSYVKGDVDVVSFFNNNFPLTYFLIGDDKLPGELYVGLGLLFPEIYLNVYVQESNGGECWNYIVEFGSSGLDWWDEE
jgi:hypothetical protein